MGVLGKRPNRPILDYDEPELIDLSSKEKEYLVKSISLLLINLL